jgi:hypothetical protein
MSEQRTENEGCLRDGKPCAPDGAGGCYACDDLRGGYRTSNPPCKHSGHERNAPWGCPYCEIDRLQRELVAASAEEDRTHAALKIVSDANTRLRAALERAIGTLEWVSIFVKSRERVKRPEGEELFDKEVQSYREALGNNRATSQQVVADETSAPRSAYREALIKNVRGVYERLWIKDAVLTDHEAEWLIRAVAEFRGDPPIPADKPCEHSWDRTRYE